MDRKCDRRALVLNAPKRGTTLNEYLVAGLVHQSESDQSEQEWRKMRMIRRPM